MTSTPASNLDLVRSGVSMLSKTGKLWLLIIGLLFLAYHYHIIYVMARIGMNDPDWSHVLIIPFISLYYIHLNRKSIMATPRSVCRWGLPFIVAGIAGYVLGIYPVRNHMVTGYSMILTLFGITLLLLGPSMMRRLWFPIFFLGFGIKVSDAIWSVIASKMQTFAAYGAVIILDLASPLTGMNATLRGSTIDLDYFSNGQHIIDPMNVAEACAGMRMLMAFLALGVALAFLFPRFWWQRLIMIALAAPIAIFVNALRIAVLGWVHLIDPELAQDDAHLLIGMFMLIPAAGLLMLVGWCLDKIVIMEGKRRPAPPPIAFEDDPNELHIDKPGLIRGSILGIAIIGLLGATYILLINQLVGGTFLSWLSGGLSMPALIAGGALFLGVLVFAGIQVNRGSNQTRMVTCQSIVGGMLLVAAAGQFGALNAMDIALTKKPVPLRHGLALSFPDRAGDWQLLHLDPRLQKDIEDELGTSEYFTRFYVDRAAGVAIDDIEKVTVETKHGEQLVGWKGIEKPGAVATVHIAYYTGMLDAVPHVPDRCWVAAGSQPMNREIRSFNISRYDYEPDPDHPGMVQAKTTGFSEKKTVRLPSDTIDAVVFTGADESGNETTALYFFLASGDIVPSSHRVRFSFNFKDKYSYYCKVEVQFRGVTDPDEVVKHAEVLLSDLMPEIMACLPDWTEVEAGLYPDDNPLREEKAKDE